MINPGDVVISLKKLFCDDRSLLCEQNNRGIVIEIFPDNGWLILFETGNFEKFNIREQKMLKQTGDRIPSKFWKECEFEKLRNTIKNNKFEPFKRKKDSNLS